MIRGALAAIAVLSGALAGFAEAQDRAGFVILLGKDTVAAESYSRTAGNIDGRIVARSPHTSITYYQARLRLDSSVFYVQTMTRLPGETDPGQQTAQLLIASDSAQVRLTSGDSSRTFMMPVRYGVPWLDQSIALYEPLLRYATFTRRDSIAIDLLPFGARTFPATLKRVASQTFELRHPGGVNRIDTDEIGRILRWDGSGSTVQVRAERQLDVDVEAIAQSFAAADRAGKPMGALSPRDSAVLALSGTRGVIVYSRPARRGRTIFGGVVPWGEVWRTGANAATSLRTDRELLMGDTRVPAGAYTLWTVPSRDGWLLVVNGQTGQWGTMYDAGHDIARIPMRVERLTSRVERFTISFAPGKDDTRLTMEWDNVRAFVPVRVP